MSISRLLAKAIGHARKHGGKSVTPSRKKRESEKVDTESHPTVPAAEDPTTTQKQPAKVSTKTTLKRVTLGIKPANSGRHNLFPSRQNIGTMAAGSTWWYAYTLKIDYGPSLQEEHRETVCNFGPYETMDLELIVQARPSRNELYIKFEDLSQHDTCAKPPTRVDC